MTGPEYQRGYSKRHEGDIYHEPGRRRKAGKIMSVLEDHYGGGLSNLFVLDVGCSTGVMDEALAGNMQGLVGVDIDSDAVKSASVKYPAENLSFMVQDGTCLGFKDSSFDAVICSQVYEHTPSADALMSEIHRVLRPGGVCYFAATNRLRLMEQHYRLPLLSLMPKSLAHVYLRLTGRGGRYYEKHLTLWGLQKLVSDFKVLDYTGKAVEDPVSFGLTDMIRPGTAKQKAALACLKIAYWLFPGYIWLLVKPAD
ncbi:MAG: methyltransferase domain-containing protein [Candidatus Altiarchaeales archaeon]|nr:methyltransferase domain-containing protein [Candidatus Altiarchaeales archaeon]MBD3417292.1 methyltransferase domain-containing protein [Candidatus Altiarchaeales archaeon]